MEEESKMRINQGLTLMLLAIAGIVSFHFLKMDDYISVFFFILGFGLFRFNEYWGEKHDK